MRTFESHARSYSLVTAILPRQRAPRVVDEVLASGAGHALMQNARGSLVKGGWYRSFLPALSPEQEIIRFIAPAAETEHLMEQIVMVGNLRAYGAGSIFAVPCEELSCADDFPLWVPGRYRFESVSFDIRFKEDLVVLLHIADRGEAEGIARAAIRAGAQGPTISYVRGYGLRDRLGLLRITKTHDKELITVVVDQCDADAVFEAMAAAGRVDQPGRGFLYQVPASRGLTNLSSVFLPHKHSANIQQIVRAIDEIQGDTDWRANHLLIHDPRAEEFKQGRLGNIKDSMVLNVMSHRKDTDSLLTAALEAGVPGASLGNWRFTEAEAEHTEGGVRINREFGIISMILKPSKAKEIQEALQERISENDMRETCLFGYAAPLAKTYVS